MVARSLSPHLCALKVLRGVPLPWVEGREEFRVRYDEER